MSDKDFVNQMCLLTACGASPRFNLRNLAGRVAFCLLLMAAHAPAVLAATINVDGDCSLANAIRSANGAAQTGAMSSCETGDSGADTINFTRDVSLTEALPTITSDVTLEGNNRTLRRASSAGDMRLLRATGAGSLTINNLTLRDGRPAATDENGTGGAIWTNTRALTISSSTFINNRTVLAGGAIWVKDADMTISDSAFIGNTSSGASFNTAGAIGGQGSGNITIIRSSFRSNSAHSGGAIHLEGGLNFRVEGSEFIDNAAVNDSGGAIVVAGTVTIEISTSSFIGNQSGVQGGAIVGGLALTIRDSAFVGNQSTRGGGAISTIAQAIIENSTFYGNRSTSGIYFGAALLLAEAASTLRHITILNSGTGLNSLAVTEGATLNMVNSVIAGSEGSDCFVLANSSIGTNINNWIEDGTCSAAFSGDPMLSTPRGSPAFIPPYIGSGLVDAVPNDANCLATDQVGRARPVGDACDIGAYEGAISRPVKEEARSVKAPTPARSTCLSLPASIRVTGLSESTQCQRVNVAQIGAAALRESFIDAVDVWSWVLPGTEVCFRADSGKIFFIDTTVLPRTVAELPAYRVDGFICAMINRAGQAVLMPGPPAPLPSVRSRGLHNCVVRTNTVVMFRHTPAGAFISFTGPRGDWIAGWLPANVTLTALARTDGWFKVDYHGVQGWISADYVSAAGDCA